MRAYIISWLPPDEEKRKSRLDAHKQQVEWLHSKKITDIHVFSMDWKESEKMYDKGITYHDAPKSHPSEGRNELLKIHYASDETWGLFLDDDGVLDSREQGDIIEWLGSNDLPEVDLFVPLNTGYPGQGAFKKDWSDNADIYENNWVFIKGINCKGTVMFVKNIKKVHGKEIWQRTKDEVSCGEDFIFALDFIKNGLKFYINRNVLLKELSTKAQGTWMESEADRHSYKEIIAKLFKEEGVTFENNQLKMKQFWVKHPVQKDLLVPKTNSNSLFSF